MDPFQPGDVVHLCYTAVRIKQQQRRGALKSLISIYLSGAGRQPFIDLLHFQRCTAAPVTLWGLRPVKSGFKELTCEYNVKDILTEKAAVRGAAGLISKEDVGSGKIDVS